MDGRARILYDRARFGCGKPHLGSGEGGGCIPPGGADGGGGGRGGWGKVRGRVGGGGGGGWGAAAGWAVGEGGGRGLRIGDGPPSVRENVGPRGFSGERAR